jgi:PAS domain S-box-containing protein
MSGFTELPRGARRLILVTAALAAGAVAVRVPEVSGWTRGDVAILLILILASALAEQFSIPIHHRTETENFSLTDAVWVPALLLAKPSVLTFAVIGGTVLGQSIRHWAWYKILYNTSQFVLAITAAEFVYHLFGAPDTLSLMTWLAGTVAMMAYFVLNETFIACIVAEVEGEPMRSILLLPAGLNILHAAGNITIGMLVALVWSTGPAGLPLLVAPVVLSYLAYRGWVQSREEEQQARERERMRTLYEAGRALFGPLDMQFDFQPFLQLVLKMVDAAGVELVLLQDGQVRVYNSETGLSLTAALGGEEQSPERYVGSHPGLSTYLAPISAAEELRGALAVHRSPALSPSEGSLVEALASQVYVKQENERLFQETMEQRSHLQDVIGNTSDGIFVVSPTGQILSWNPAMVRITRFTRTEAVGRPCDDVLRLRLDPGEDGGEVIGTLQLDSMETQDALAIRRDGSERWIRYTSSPMPDRDGTAKAYVVVARDVTAELEAERMKGDFVATVSHELRTPLTPLKGFLQSLEQGLVEDSVESRHEYYRIMLRQAERLERLIDDLLDVSRIDSGRLAIEPLALNLCDLVAEQVRDAERQPSTHPLTLMQPDDAVWVLADPLRVGQVLSNLLSNALKYSPSDTPIEIRVDPSGPQAVVSVHNEGEGIASAERDRVFERFYRAEGGLTSSAGGVGLGLYIARRLTEAMGGQLSLATEPGRGCTFSFSLPLATSVAAPDGALASA